MLAYLTISFAYVVQTNTPVLDFVDHMGKIID